MLTWWGTFEIAEGQAGRWRVGPLSLCATRNAGEWRLAWTKDGDALDDRLEVACPVDAAEVAEEGEVVRFLSNRMPEKLTLTPVLGDRPFVHRPQTPLCLLPDDEAALFVSSPVWLRVETGDPLHILTELPTWRPSDTWFGPATRGGELCYSNRTNARFNLRNVPVRPHRAITQIVLRNDADSLLRVERMSLPMPNLSLYVDADGDLWTGTVNLRRDRQGSLATIDLAAGPPAEAPEPRRVGGPRVPLHRNLLVRALGGLLD